MAFRAGQEPDGARAVKAKHKRPPKWSASKRIKHDPLPSEGVDTPLARRPTSRARQTQSERPPTETFPPQREHYRPWKDRVAVELARRHGICAGEIGERVWRTLFIRGKTLEEAVEAARVHYQNMRPAADRLRRRLTSDAS